MARRTRRKPPTVRPEPDHIPELEWLAKAVKEQDADTRRDKARAKRKAKAEPFKPS